MEPNEREKERLVALRRYGILNTPPEAAFDDLVQLASQLCGTPIAGISFVDDHREWFKSVVGCEMKEVPREGSLTWTRVESGDWTQIEDISEDPKSSVAPTALLSIGARFVAAAPLVNPHGAVVGALTVIDRIPRKLTPQQIEALRTLGRQVVTHLELRVHVNELQQEVEKHRLTETAMRDAEFKYRSIFENVVEGIYQTTPAGNYISANPMLARIYGYETPEALIESVNDISRQLYVNPDRRGEFVKLMQEHGVISKFESQIFQKNGEIIWISENSRAVRDTNGRLLYYEGTVEDITDRKRTEETLKHSEMRFRSVWEKSVDGMRLTDRNGLILAVNPAFCSIVGMEAGEMLGRPFTVIYNDDEESDERLMTYLDRFDRREVAGTMERRMVFRSQKTVDLELSNSFVEGDGKNPLLLSIFHDVTVRKRTEDALRDSELLYHSLVESLPQYIFRKDLEERFTFANQRFCKALGKSVEEIIGKTDFDFFPPELAAKYRRDDRRILETGKTFETIEAHLSAKNEKMYVQVVKTPLYDVGGKISGIQGMFWDVTERKKIEEQLAFERDLLRALLDNVPDRVFFKDTSCRFLKVSLALARRLGLENPEEVVGKTDFDFHPEEAAKEYREDEQRVVLTGQPMINKIERQLSLDGGELWASVTKVPLRNRAGIITGIIGLSRDITALKKAEEELAVARDAALESVRLKSEFLATMSHEIRTPMNAIIGMTGLLLDAELNEEQKDYTETIRSSADALLNIINDILDFSKIEAGKLILEEIDFDLRESVESTVELLGQRAQSKHIELISFVPHDIPRRLRGDPGRLRQILINLVGNAVKFTEHGEVVVQVEMEEEHEHEVILKLTVSDTGIGIPKESAGHIFEPFTQADGSTTRRYGGTGLGLAISKQLVELMRGEIGLDSVPGEGSTFWFTIRLKKSNRHIEAPSDETQPLHGQRILIVEGNATSRTVLEQQAKAWGMVVTLAEDGASSRRQWLAAVREARPFDVLLVDQDMPGESGIRLVHDLRGMKEWTGVPVVLISSLTGRLDSAQLKVEGLAGIVIKPVKEGRLKSVLLRVISGVSTTEEPSGEGPGIGATAGTSLRRTLRILLAEDNVVNQKVARLQLKKLGYAADVVANGFEAVEAVQRVPYDVVLMDCQMPEMDGYQATRRIREFEATQTPMGGKPPLFIVAMTANALDGDREACLEAGMDAYVTKPVQIEELFSVLSRFAESPSVPVPPVVTPVAEKPSPSGVEGDSVDTTVLAGLRDLREPGQPDPLVELVDMFLRDVPERLKAIDAAIQRNDMKALHLGAHTLKGSCSNLGARKMAGLCANLDRAVKAGDFGAVNGALEQVRLEFESVRTVLEREKLR